MANDEINDQAIRIDRAQLPRMARTDEGYLRGEAIATRLGVFTYINADGSERRELRHPDDVLDSESLASLAMIPVTVDHPAALVNRDNAKDLAVGMTGENHRVDGRHIIVPMTITHTDGVTAVENGKKELSLGYAVDLIPERGEYNGESYTHRQTNIRYNHLAIVSQARAGRNARINLDGAAVQSVNQAEEFDMSDIKLATVNLDGLEYQAAPEVAKAFTKAQAELETVRADAEKTKKDMQKEIDGYQAKIDQLKSDMEKLKEERGDEAVAQAAKARIALLAKAGKVINADEMFESTDREIMEAVIKSRHDSLDLAEKSDDYVVARFDAVLESLPTDDGIKKQAEKAGARADASEGKTVVSAMDIVRNQWKGKEA